MNSLEYIKSSDFAKNRKSIKKRKLKRNKIEYHHTISVSKFLEWHLENLDIGYTCLKPISLKDHKKLHKNDYYKTKIGEGLNFIDKIKKTHKTNYLMPNI